MSYKDKRRREKERYREQREERAAERRANTARKYVPPPFQELRPRPSRYVETDAMMKTRLLPSHQSDQKESGGHQDVVGIADLDFSQLEARVAAFAGTPEGEKLARELVARQESKKFQTAPLYPKGPYQLITDPNAPKYFNRKDGGIENDHEL